MTMNAEQKRYIAYQKVYLENQPEPVDPMLEGGNAGAKAAATKQAKYGPAMMRPEAHVAAMTQPPRNGRRPN